MSEFFAMGGYARWVWSSFGLAAFVLVINVVLAGRRYRRALTRLQMRQSAAARRTQG